MVAEDDEGFGPVVRGSGGGRRRRDTDDADASGDGAHEVLVYEAPVVRDRTRVYESPPDHVQAPPAGYAPPDRGDRGRRRTEREPSPRQRGGGLRRLMVLLLVLALIPAGLGLAALTWVSGQIDRVPVAGLSSATTTMNILVIGSDSRAELDAEEASDLGTGTVAGQRTDTIFVLSVRGGDAALLSFPRDLLVTRCDGTDGRINAAYSREDGRSCIVDTVQSTSGIALTHYLELSFTSVVRVVDALGGITVDLEAPIVDAAANIDLPAGEQRLTPEQALGFVRVRGIDDDFGRIGRQQYFVQQLAREALSPATLLNPVQGLRTAGAAANALTADEDLGAVDLARLGWGARTIAGGDMPSYTVPADPEMVGQAAMLRVRPDESEALFEAFRSGSVFTDPPPTDDG